MEGEGAFKKNRAAYSVFVRLQAKCSGFCKVPFLPHQETCCLPVLKDEFYFIPESPLVLCLSLSADMLCRFWSSHHCHTLHTSYSVGQTAYLCSFPFSTMYKSAFKHTKDSPDLHQVVPAAVWNTSCLVENALQSKWSLLPIVDRKPSNVQEKQNQHSWTKIK